MRRIRLNSPAMVVALVALVVAMGGSSYAAVKIGTKNLKNSSVTSAKIKNGTIVSKDVSRGARVALKGQKGDKGDAGPKGDSGTQGPPGPFATALPSGQTLRGVFGIYGHGEENNGLEAASGDVSFNPPLASAPSVKVVQFGTASSPPECAGTADSPEAAAGWLCVYENRAQNQRAGEYPTVSAPGSGFSPSASRFGASLVVQGQAAGTDWFYWSEGTWAVTAP